MLQKATVRLASQGQTGEDVKRAERYCSVVHKEIEIVSREEGTEQENKGGGGGG
jgi:hypothetical protein